MHEELKRRASHLREWNKRLVNGVTLGLVRTDGAQSRAMEAFIRDFCELAPKIRVENREGRAEDLPGFSIGESWRLHFVPEGTELDPFLGLLSTIDRGQVNIADPIRSLLEQQTGNRLLTLFLSTRCPNCTAVMRQIAPLPLVNPRIHLTVIDGLLFPDLASSQGIRAVPTLIGENGMRWTGEIHLESVIEALVQSDGEYLGKENLERMISEGNAAPLADIMIRTGRVPPAFLDILTSEQFSTRLGAMVIMEDLGERAPDLARAGLSALWEKMAGLDETIRGDIVYLVGVIGDSAWIPRLESVIRGPLSPAMQEAVQDALEALGARRPRSEQSSI